MPELFCKFLPADVSTGDLINVLLAREPSSVSRSPFHDVNFKDMQRRHLLFILVILFQCPAPTGLPPGIPTPPGAPAGAKALSGVTPGGGGGYQQGIITSATLVNKPPPDFHSFGTSQRSQKIFLWRNCSAMHCKATTHVKSFCNVQLQKWLDLK